MVRKAHPTSFKSLEVMKKEQASSEIKLSNWRWAAEQEFLHFMGDSRMGNIVLVTI